MRARVLLALLEQALAEAGGQAARERDHALCVALHQAQVHVRLAALQALQKAGRGQLYEIAIALVVTGQQGQVVALCPVLRRRRVVVDEVDLTADDRLDAVLAAGVVQLHRAVHHSVIGQTERRLAELRGAGGEILDLAGAVEQRVLGVHVQMGAGV